MLTGAGRFFCAGADLKERDGMSDQAWSDQHVMFEAMIRAQLACPFPVIAAVNGAAMGGGMGLAATCDICIAGDKAMFATSEVRLGLAPSTISPYVIRAIGERQAQRYFLTAERISAAKAAEIASSL